MPRDPRPVSHRFFVGLVNAIVFMSCFCLGIGLLLWLFTGGVR